MQMQMAVLIAGLAGGLITMSWLLVRYVSGYRYRKLVNDRLEKMALNMRIQNACSQAGG
jgi:hypothetical protein